MRKLRTAIAGLLAAMLLVGNGSLWNVVPPHIVRAAPPAQVPGLQVTLSSALPPVDSYINPGDTLAYTVTITNRGNAGVAGVWFNDPLDFNTTLAPGSVQTSQGVPSMGNNTVSAIASF